MKNEKIYNVITEKKKIYIYIYIYIFAQLTSYAKQLTFSLICRYVTLKMYNINFFYEKRICDFDLYIKN